MAFMGLTRRQLVTVVVLILGTFVAVLNQTIMTPALPTIMSDMNVDTSTAQWLTTGFTLVNAIMIPITAFLIDRYNLKTLFAIAMGVFAAGSLMCGVSPVFAVLLAGRLVQAMGAGILQPLTMTVLLRTFPIERRGTAMGLFGVVIAFAPAIGPTLSGIVIDSIGWQILFYVIALLAVIIVVVALFVLERDDSACKDVTLDIASVILSSIGFGALLYGLSCIGSYGVSVASGVGVAVGCVALVFFFRRQLSMDQPMLQVRVLANRHFLIATIIGMLVQAALMAGSVLLPIYIQTDLGYSATVSGLVMLPSALLMGIMSPISGTLFDKYGPRVLSIVGMTITTITTACFMFLTDATPAVYLAVLYGVRAFGMSLTNMPINTWGMNALPDSLINHGTSVSNTFRQVAGSFGTAVITSVYSIVMAGSLGAMGDIDASVHGINIAFGVSTGMCLVGLVLVIALVGRSNSRIEKTPEKGERASSSVLASIMKEDVYGVPVDATVLEAVEMFVEQGINGAPVLDESGAAVGFVSDGDIVRYLSKNNTMVTDMNTMITHVLTTGTQDQPLDNRLDELLDMNVMGVATQHVTGVEAGTDIIEVCRTMSAHRLKKAPVFDNGVVVGMVSRGDVLKYALESYKARREALVQEE